MKQLFILAFLSALLLSMTGHPAEKLYGKWLEEWPVEEDGVEYIDTLEIGRASNGKLMIKCLSQPAYFYKGIEFDGSVLEFTMVNPKDPEDIYEVNYSLIFDKDINKLEGKALNNKGDGGEVILRRIIE